MGMTTIMRTSSRQRRRPDVLARKRPPTDMIGWRRRQPTAQLDAAS
jgi:hypothetical protein